MSSDFDFGAMLDAQFGGIRKGYKFGKAFNEDKSLVRPEKRPVVAGTEDNVAIKAAFEAGEAIAGLVSDDQLSDDFIMPEAFDPRVADVVSKAVRDHIR